MADSYAATRLAIDSGPPRGLTPGEFTQVEDMGRYEAWVRNGRAAACLTG